MFTYFEGNGPYGFESVQMRKVGFGRAGFPDIKRREPTESGQHDRWPSARIGMTTTEMAATTMPGTLRSGASCRISVEPDSYTMNAASAMKHQPPIRYVVRSTRSRLAEFRS